MISPHLTPCTNTPANLSPHEVREISAQRIEASAIAGGQRDSVRRTSRGVYGGAAKADQDCQIIDLIPLVRRMAARMRRNLPAHIELDDLVGAGILGLLDATRRFDSTKQVRIESYARHRIRGAILDGLRSLDTASRDLRKKNRRMERSLLCLEMKFCRPVEDEEAAHSLGISLEKWHRDLQELQAAGVDWPRPIQMRIPKNVNEENLPAENQPNQYDFCYLRERRDIARQALACLSARERTIITLYHLRELTMKEIGARLRIDESRVSQLHSSALARLRLTVAAILSRPRHNIPTQFGASTFQAVM